jgi:cyclopropane fatty-acyl-phospholipid synthase-like methyltransferase
MPDRVPYDLIAERWSRDRAALGFREQPYVDRFLRLAAPGGHILDLGCGSGRPIARYLLDRGYRVTGVDASAEMLRLARANCPEADFVLADFTAAQLPGAYDGIVAWDSVFHLPKAQHATLFRAMHRWLKPGAPVLLSVGGTADEFVAPMFGIDFFYSGHSPDASLALLRDAGFEIVLAEVDDPTSRGHVAAIGRSTGR